MSSYLFVQRVWFDIILIKIMIHMGMVMDNMTIIGQCGVILDNMGIYGDLISLHPSGIVGC